MVLGKSESCFLGRLRLPYDPNPFHGDPPGGPSGGPAGGRLRRAFMARQMCGLFFSPSWFNPL